MTSAALSAGVAAETDVVLRDGSTVHVRPSTVEDEPRLRAFLASLSEESRWFRFFSAGVDLERPRPAPPTPDGLSLIALHGPEGTVVATAPTSRAPERAEVAFAVADDWQGHGIATILLAHLAQAASAAGSRRSPRRSCRSNHRMLAGLPRLRASRSRARRSWTTAIEFEFPTSLSREARERFEERERAGRRRGRRARAAARLGRGDRRVPAARDGRRRGRPQPARGRLLAVRCTSSTRRAETSHGRPTVRSIADVEERRRARGHRRARGRGRRRSRERAPPRACARSSSSRRGSRRSVPRAVRARTSCSPSAGRRACGWSARTASASPTATRDRAQRDVRARPRRRPASVAFASQSGGVRDRGDRRRRRRAASGSRRSSRSATRPTSPATTSWSTGSRTPTRRSCCSTWSRSATRAASAGSRAASRTAKPIVAVKSGRSAAGRRAASSHTGALLAASDVTVDALFAHAGVIRAETVGEMFDVAGLLARQPLPRGDRVAVLTNAGGPGHPLRRRLRGRGPAGRAAVGRHARAARRGAAAGGLDREPGRHDRLGDRRPVRALAARPARRRRRRRGRDDLRAAARHARGGGRPRHRRRGRGQPTSRCSPSGSAPTRRRPATRAPSRASPRPRRRCGRSPTPSATRAAAPRRPTRPSSPPTPTSRRRRRSSPRASGAAAAGCRPTRSSAC